MSDHIVVVGDLMFGCSIHNYFSATACYDSDVAGYQDTQRHPPSELKIPADVGQKYGVDSAVVDVNQCGYAKTQVDSYLMNITGF